MVEMIAAMECKTEEAWVGSGRVGWTPIFTQLDPSLTLFSLRRGYRAVNHALRFIGCQ